MPSNQRPALQRPTPRPQNRQNRNNQPNHRPNNRGNGGGGNRNRGGGGGNHHGNGGGNNNPQPSPWLDPDHQPPTSHNGSFIEYLRWMRPPEHPQKDGTKVEILNKAQDKPDYRERLKTLNKRTRDIAKEHFKVKTTWRIRVGGHRGPENILLPAFDHLGVPYLPSSTLRGVARTQAIREMMAKENINWKNAEEKIAPYFGSINTNNNPDKAGKVVFLDAYPVACKNAGVTMDMTNNIWNWGDNNQLAYSPNPNSFFSLKDVEFLVGLRLASNCQDQQVLKQVKQWLIEGLNAGVGSQINSGYGQLTTEKNKKSANEFLSVSFGLEGQLIHGCQHFTEWRLDRRNQWQMRGNPQAEVRPVAFKSMLRYWFRVFALGVLSPQQVQEWEAAIFGGISPQKRGFLEVRIHQGKLEQREPKPNQRGKNDPCGEQSGVLILGLSSETQESERKTVQSLVKNLTWMMFQLGGIGQGARRPCYSRQTRDRAPWFRGSTFLAGEEDFWEIPEDIQSFRNLFRQKLEGFYSALSQLTGQSINLETLNQVGEVNRGNWQEVVDCNCEIVVCSGKSNSNKPFALSVLHDRAFYHNGDYDGFLCGKVRGGVKPSPVWIADTGDFQVVTVFGATADPREKYLKELRDRADQCLSIFPLK